ncbi:uncharacterized protein K444DRAFT_24743 [Hyaloscypha bicolor E]|uniref:Clr5 domain-containing protein n=1 Tax=Hyaloscypha bicolor E TaxID=1095630 RepID=A0A2J6T450_9HELO|nr:uncharacterized protein K444DRAFT_24743 [Hyaloscypha bicolor E]PMD57804.1 hypothetical protein K444DRAFT_24743 [Hyaloscypha bicolor E]
MEGSFSGLVWGTASFATAVAPQDEKGLTILPEPTRLPEMNQRRERYPKEQWLALKSIIEQLYVKEGQTLTKVVEYLAEHHDFYPTTKPFKRWISEWGFEKNVKRDERRAILERLGTTARAVDFQATMLRGRRLDKAKIERWRKRDGIGGGSSRKGPEYSGMSDGTPKLSAGSLPSEMELCNQDNTPKDLPRPGEPLGSMPTDQISTFNPWLAVDIVGSPSLTGLIGAYTLDLCEDIPALDLLQTYSEASEDDYDLMDPYHACSAIVCGKVQNQQPPSTLGSNSVSFGIATLSTYFSNQSQLRMPGPLDEVSPFPQGAPKRRLFKPPDTSHLVSNYSLKTKELECKRKFKASKSMERLEIIDLVEDMEILAWRHYELNQHRLAETWWRRVITSSSEIPGYHPFKILYACLQVVASLRRQHRLQKSLSLHQGVHNKIMELVSPDHELALKSRAALAKLRQLAETMWRNSRSTGNFFRFVSFSLGQGIEIPCISC